jgi:imidazolonepropionase-like amidohydrolase
MYGIRAGRAFDGERVVPGGALVLVADGRIAGVEPAAAPVPDGCQVLEVPGGTVLPGLVDAHVHLCGDGTDGTLDRIGEPTEDAMMAVIEESLRRHLAAGVTTVRDLGDRRFAVLDWRSSARSGSGVYPAVVAAGPPITSPGGHCAAMGGEAAGEDQLRAAVRERAERGVDVVKIMASGGFATTGTQVMLCQFTLDETRAVVGEAHAAGLPVTAHAHGLPAVRMAMAAGVDGIEHCSFLTDKGVSQSEEDLARLAEAGTAVCPTMGTVGTLVPPPNAVATLGKLGMTMEQMIEMRKRRVAQMHAAGVRVVSGSDGGIAAAKPHGVLPVSLAFLVEGGMSTVAALASATALAADACGLGDRKGRLRAGYDADLLVVDGDPVADIGALARPVAVFAAGRQLNRAGPWPFRMVEELPWSPARACGCRAGDREQFT